MFVLFIVVFQIQHYAQSIISVTGRKINAGPGEQREVEGAESGGNSPLPVFGSWRIRVTSVLRMWVSVNDGAR